MGLYLLNATLIWGFSLLAYELLFRNETVHHWNRAYLLLTPLLGILLPLWTWYPVAGAGRSPVVVYAAAPAVRLDAVKAVVVRAAAPERAPLVFSWWLVYGAGAAVALLRLLRDAGRIASLYRAGVRTRQHGWTLVETGREHSPFSFFQWVFLPGGAAPDPEGCRLVLQHERRHGRLLHSIDAVLLQLVQVAFWFHPLVYAYRHRLALVHEYQADAAAGTDVEAYGHLLLAQATGAPVSSLVHSFNRSPLKNRIAMLVKHPSGAVRLLRYAVTLPLVAGCALFCSRLAHAQEKKDTGRVVVYSSDNVITMPASKAGKLRFKDGNPESTEFVLQPLPAELNGQKVYNEFELTTPAVYTGPAASAAEQLFQAIQQSVSRLPDRQYAINFLMPVVSAKGELVYFQTDGIDFPGIRMSPRWREEMDSLRKFRKPIDPALKKDIDARIQQALRQSFRFKPATRDGEAVAAYLGNDLGGLNNIEVKGGRARLVPPHY